MGIDSEHTISHCKNGFKLCSDRGERRAIANSPSSRPSEIYKSVEVAFSKLENKISSWSGVRNFEIRGYDSSYSFEIVSNQGVSGRFLREEMAEKGELNKNDILKRFMAFTLSTNNVTCVRGRLG